MITWDAQTIMAVLGGIVLLGNAGAVIYKWIAPALQIKKKVEELDRRTINDYEMIQKLEKTVEQSEQVSRIHLVVLLNTINHMIDGNGVDELKETRKDIEEILAGIKTE